jgi:hypothetical protein
MVYGVPPPPLPPKKKEAGGAAAAVLEYSSAKFVMHNIHNFTTVGLYTS